MFGSKFLSAAAALFFLAPAVLSAPVAAPTTQIVDASTYTSTITTTFTEFKSKVVSTTSEIKALDVSTIDYTVVASKVQYIATEFDQVIAVVAGLKLKVGAELDVSVIAGLVVGVIQVVLELVVAVVLAVGVKLSAVPSILLSVLVLLGTKIQLLLLAIKVVVPTILEVVLALVAKLEYEVYSVVEIIAFLKITICFGFFGISV